MTENNLHNPMKPIAKRVYDLDKNCGNYRGKCQSVSKVLTTTLIPKPLYIQKLTLMSVARSTKCTGKIMKYVQQAI